MNLFVKNLDDTVTEEQFRDTFAAYGTITSARIMKDEQTGSKGFGFVCYSTPEEAARALTELNGKLVKSKPIVVTLHQRREVRRAQLAASYGRRIPFPGGQQPQMPYNMPMMYAAQQQQQPQYMPPQGGPQGRYPPQMPFQRGGSFPPNQGGRYPSGPTGPGGRGGYSMSPYALPNAQGGRGMPMQGRGGMPTPMMMGPGGRGNDGRGRFQGQPGTKTTL